MFLLIAKLKKSIEKGLATANKAKKEKNWQSVYDYAVAVLKIDGACRKALILKQDSEDNLIPASAQKQGLILSSDNKTITDVQNKLLTSVEIPYGISTIEGTAFLGGCWCLANIYIPNTVTYIGDGAFGGVNNLTNISIPKHFTDADVKKWQVPRNCRVIRRK